MAGKIRNKQLLINSDFDINAQRLINVANPINLSDAINKDYFLSGITNKIEGFDISLANMNLYANSGTTIFLAVSTAIVSIPETIPRVEVNGIPVSIGNGTKLSDCFFSNDDGITAKTLTNISQGDYLYWNSDTATFDLESDDIIDIIYYIIT